MAIDFRLRDFFHPYEIVRLRRTLERTQWLPREELLRYQNQKLAVTLKQAYDQVPYYRRIFDDQGLHPRDISNGVELAALPLLLKNQLRSLGRELHARNAARYSPRVYQTSGTSGAPLSILLDKGANVLEFVYYWRHWSWAGYRLGDRFAELGSQYFLNRPTLVDEPVAWQPAVRRLMLNSNLISIEYANVMVAAIRRYRPRFLKGLASAIYYLALSLREAGIDDIHFEAVFSTGEIVIPQYRTFTEETFSCRLLDSYGHMERAVGISECLAGGYHVIDDYGLLEFVDSKTLSNGATVSRAVGTTLYNMAMPLLRYEIGDEIETFSQPCECPCGRGFPLIKAIHGRVEDTIVTPDGRFITSMFILPEFVQGIRFAQFIQTRRDMLEVLVVPGQDWSRHQREHFRRLVQDVTGPGMQIEFWEISEDELLKDASGKRRTVIQFSQT